MEPDRNYDVIIIGGSYAGLQAAMTLGRALRKVLVIDSGEPCNIQTPHSHNFLTQDGETPAAIAGKAKEQLKKYTTVSFLKDRATYGMLYNDGFEIRTSSGKTFIAGKLLFASGIKDVLPEIRGFADCWGISVLHCPYCHGYEVHHRPTGILSYDDHTYEFAKIVSNWTADLTLYTNGPATLTEAQLYNLKTNHIKVVEKEVLEIAHQNGQIQELKFTDGSSAQLDVLYARLPFTQHCTIPQQLGCLFTETGLISVDNTYKTNIPGVYAAGDCVTVMRSVANVVAGGAGAGAFITKELIEAGF